MSVLPTYVTYFEVTIPHRAYDSRRSVEERLDRYLYSGFERVGSAEPPLTDDLEWKATVRFESYGGDENYRRVDNMRDRLASGGMGASEPTYYQTRP